MACLSPTLCLAVDEAPHDEALAMEAELPASEGTYTLVDEASGIPDVRFYQRNRTQVNVVILASLLQTGLVVALLVQWKRRKKIEESLQDRDAWIQQAVQAVNLGLWMWNSQTDSVDCSAESKSLLGLEAEGHLTLEAFLQPLDTQDQDNARSAIAAACEADGNCAIDVHLKLANGVTRWLFIQGSVDHTLATGPRRMRVF